ncbi:MAG: Holliday junction branch migration protein RuvA [Marinilabiliales bacterium]|nr:Holliday junction branch migration protein RuvA [Marinilabiliales bacterium]
MYEYLKGTVVSLSPASVVLESGDIGYFVHISLTTYSQLHGNDQVKLFLHQVIREDAHLLYGFADLAERELFRLLISVSGIGANTAILMLSSHRPEELQLAILNENLNLLKGIKGIGLKTAQRVILELKDKVGKNAVGESLFRIPANPVREEAVAALEMLGFNKKAVEKLVDQVLIEQPSIPVENLIKLALKSF